MEEQRYFQVEHDLDLTAAQIAISRWQWESIDNIDEKLARSVSTKHRFDIIPVILNNKFAGYFQTEKWGVFDGPLVYKNTNKFECAYYRMSITDLLRKFVAEKRKFFFLESSKGVVGLITLDHMNYRSVYAQVFQLIIRIEKAVADLIRANISEQEIIELFRKTSDKSCQDILKQHITSIGKNADISIFERLYFANYSTILKNLSHKIPNRNKAIVNYQKKFANDFNSVRARAAHPTKPLIDPNDDYVSARQILEVIDAAREIDAIVSR